jgi:excisionase family DNA binding protein
MPPPKKTTRSARPLALDTEILTTLEAAEDCNVSVRTIYRAIKSGKLKAYRLHREIRIKRSDLRAWFEGLAITDQDKEDMKV